MNAPIIPMAAGTKYSAANSLSLHITPPLLLPDPLQMFPLLFSFPFFPFLCYPFLTGSYGTEYLRNEIRTMPNFLPHLSLNVLLDYSLRLVDCILPFFSGIIIFYLTSIKERKTTKREALQKRLDSFYIPYYQFYCRKILNFNLLNSYPTNDIVDFLEFLSKNICNMETQSQSAYFCLYSSFSALFEARRGTPHYFLSTCSDKFECDFTVFNSKIFAEYSDICRTLKLPAPSKELCKRPSTLPPHT